MTQDWQIEMPHPEAFECIANDLLDNFVRRRRPPAFSSRAI